jgi:hypothetical protein
MLAIPACYLFLRASASSFSGYFLDDAPCWSIAQQTGITQEIT